MYMLLYGREIVAGKPWILFRTVKQAEEALGKFPTKKGQIVLIVKIVRAYGIERPGWPGLT